MLTIGRLTMDNSALEELRCLTAGGAKKLNHPRIILAVNFSAGNPPPPHPPPLTAYITFLCVIIIYYYIYHYILLYIYSL